MNEVKIKKERCKECMYCIHFCPQGVLEKGTELNEKGFYPPVFAHPEKCIACGICARMCPDALISVYKEEAI